MAQITLGGSSSPSISTATTPILVQRTTSPPPGDSSPASIDVTRQSYPSLVLYTIPPIEISTKSPTWGNFHPASPTPRQLVCSNQSRSHRRKHPPGLLWSPRLHSSAPS